MTTFLMLFPKTRTFCKFLLKKNRSKERHFMYTMTETITLVFSTSGVVFYSFNSTNVISKSCSVYLPTLKMISSIKYFNKTLNALCLGNRYFGRESCLPESVYNDVIFFFSPQLENIIRNCPKQQKIN
jgi:hypothetical protein